MLYLPRLVSLTRQSLRTRKMEDRELKANDGRDPDFTFKNPSSSKGGVFETFIRVSIEDDIIILFGKTFIFEYFIEDL